MRPKLQSRRKALFWRGNFTSRINNPWRLEWASGVPGSPGDSRAERQSDVTEKFSLSHSAFPKFVDASGHIVD